MKFPSKQIKLITLLVSLHDSHPNSEADVKHLLAAVGEEHFFTLIRIMEADTIAHSKWTVKKRLQQIHHVRDMAKHILDKGDCFSLKTLSINGSDLERSGLEGKNIGELLRLTLQKVISGEWKNEKTFLLSQLEKNNWQIS
jgi:tRNA nucleotidyltransferase (CCA-adding enzyme)